MTPTSIRDEIWTPEDFGLPRHAGDAWKIDGPADSAALVRRLFANEQGPALDLVLANAAGALFTAGVASNLREGVAMAREAIARGEAAAKLERARSPHTFVNATRKPAVALFGASVRGLAQSAASAGFDVFACDLFEMKTSPNVAGNR